MGEIEKISSGIAQERPTIQGPATRREATNPANEAARPLETKGDTSNIYDDVNWLEYPFVAGILPNNNIFLYYEKSKSAITEQRYNLAIAWADQILNSRLTFNNRRPPKYDEAAFIKVDALKNLALLAPNFEEAERMLTNAMDVLKTGYDLLMPAEFTLRSRYCYEMLGIMNLYKSIFGKDFPAERSLMDAASLYEKATKHQNMEVGFRDNYLALKAMREYSSFLFSAGNSEMAQEELERGLAFIRIFRGNAPDEKELSLVSEYSRRDGIDRLMPDGMFYYKVYYGDLPIARNVLPWLWGQYRDDVLDTHEASFCLAKGTLGLKSSAYPTLENIECSIKTCFQKALDIMEAKKNKAQGDFYGEGMWQERQIYYYALALKAEALKAITGIGQKEGPGNERWQNIAQCIIDYYLNGALVKADIEKIRGIDAVRIWDYLIEQGLINKDGSITDKAKEKLVIPGIPEEKSAEILGLIKNAKKGDVIINGPYNTALSLKGVLPDENDPRSVWDLLDASLEPLTGSVHFWLNIEKNKENWILSTANLLYTLKTLSENHMGVSIRPSDRPLLLARSYAWLGNLMKWVEEGKTDEAVERQIIELAKGIAKDEDKAAAETRKGAIIVLYKAALEQFKDITDKKLYLEAEEASTRYQLADMAQEILEDPKIDASDPLRTAAQKITDKKDYNNSIETAKAALAEIINKASAPEDTHIKDNAIIDYASCLAREISSLLSQANSDKAFDMVEQSFIFDEKTGKISIKTLTIAKDADGKDIHPELRSDTIDTVNTRLVIANVLMARPLQDTIDGARVPTEYLEAYKAPLAEILNSPDSGSLSIKAGVSNEKIRSELSSQNAPEDFIKILENRNSARLAKIAADNILGQALKLLELKLADKNTPETIRRDMTNKYADALSVFINLRLAQGRYEDTAEIINNHFVYDLNNPPYDISVHKENIFDAVPVTDELTAQKALLAIANARSGVAEEKYKLKALAEHISNNGVSKFIRTSAQNILLGLK